MFISGIFIIIVAYFVYATHILTPIKVHTQTFNKMNVAYVTFIGPYKDAYKNNEKTEKILSEHFDGIDFSKQPCFGVYYDDPQVTPKEKTRCIVGKILPEYLVSSNQKEALEKKGIKIATLDLNKCAVIHYPLDNIISLYVGMIRSYPELNKWLKSNKEEFPQNSAFVELYGYFAGNVSFVAPLNQTDSKENILLHFPS